jgi:membrane fusion protein, multidrug efflux system
VRVAPREWFARTVCKDTTEYIERYFMKNVLDTRSLLVMGVFVAAMALAGCGGPTQGSGPPGGGTPEVGVVVLQGQRVAITTELPGRTSPYLMAEVRPQVNGIIQKRLFDEGTDVKAGDVLYQIDPAPYEASYANAKAALARAEANLPSIRSKVERYKELVEISAVSRQEYDDASAALRQAEAESQIAKAAVETARINLAYTRIVAPISGRVGRSNITVGALATAQQASPFTAIQQLDPIYVDATESSANLLLLKRNLAAGQLKGDDQGRAKVKLILEDGTPYSSEGVLKFSDVTVDQSTGSFILRMVFPNPKHILLPGMYVRAIIQDGIVDDAILAPQQGVSRDPKGNPVAMVINSAGKVEQRFLKIDRAIGNTWLVTEGLHSGDRLIVEGLQRIRPGASAKAVPFEAGRKEGTEPGKAGRPPATTAR